MDRVIKVTKCGEKEVCGVNDRISIEFSPFEVIALTRIFGLLAVESKYRDVNESEIHDVFLMARQIWEKMRKTRNLTGVDLLEFERLASVLPLRIGDPDQPLSELITCTGISGKADFVSSMPRRLTLTRKFSGGLCFVATYEKRARKARKRKVK